MRTDIVLCMEASHAKGMGHAFRTLRLALALRNADLDVAVVGNDNAAAAELFQAAGIAMRFAPTDSTQTGWEFPLLEELQPKIWFNDRLNVSLEHAQAVRTKTRLAGIDDTSEYWQMSDTRFLTMPCTFISEPKGNTYMGVDYLILAPEFRESRHIRENTATPRLLVSMGGSDTWGATVFVAGQLAAGGIAATILTGPAFAHERALQEALSKDSGGEIKRLSFVPDITELFEAHDLLICAGGLTGFEAAASGLPCIVLATEKHEEVNAAFIDTQGFGVTLGQRRGEIFTGRIIDALDKCLDISIAKMSKTAMNTVDGQGINCVVSILLGELQ